MLLFYVGSFCYCFFTMPLSIVALCSFCTCSIRYNLFTGLLIKVFVLETLTTAPQILPSASLITFLTTPTRQADLVLFYYNNILYIYYLLMFLWMYNFLTRYSFFQRSQKWFTMLLFLLGNNIFKTSVFWIK